MIERAVSFFPDLIECEDTYEDLQDLIDLLNWVKTQVEFAVLEISDDLVCIREKLQELEKRKYPAQASAMPEGFDSNDDLPFDTDE